MSPKERIARNLAAALLAGPWNRDALLNNASSVLGTTTRLSQQRLVDDLWAAFTREYPPAPESLIRFFLHSPMFARASAPRIRKPQTIPLVLEPAEFAPAERFRDLKVPRLATPGDLADWLNITVSELDWLSDARRQQGRSKKPALQHYHYAFLPKRSGAPRLIERPKARIKAIQRRILREILDHVPQHPCVHGFVRGRSCLSAAQQHAGETVVVAADLANFFLTSRLSRVHSLFRSLGYPSAVAQVLTGLCSTATPRSVFDELPATQRPDWLMQKRYDAPHLSQGAPTSPALANLAAWGLDTRIEGLASRFDVRYTRYADDLTFSGDSGFSRNVDCFIATLDAIAQDEGFALNNTKTRIMRSSGRQRVTGIVVNEHINVPRDSFDQLKAILHNCRKNGPDAENRDGIRDFRAHLMGRIAWVESLNPRRAEKLHRAFDAIIWSALDGDDQSSTRRP